MLLDTTDLGSPTTPRKARILLKSGRAEIAFRQPFTIRLLYKTGCAHPKEMVVGIDTGSQHIGVAVVNKENTQVIRRRIRTAFFHGKEAVIRDQKNLSWGKTVPEDPLPPSEVSSKDETDVCGKSV